MSLRPGPHPVKHGRLAGTSPACIPTATRLSHGNKRGQYFPPQPGFLAGTSAVSISTATRLSHGNKRGQYFPPQPGFLTGTSPVSIPTRNPAVSRAQARSVFPPATRLSHGNKPGQYFHPQPGFLTGTSPVNISTRNPAFSRAQARSAPRAHVRELLCETQSSKEQLRRSRTESSAAPPATEELAGEARQVRPARAACGSVSTDFGLLTGEEVWRATGPPAPASIISARKFSIPPPHRPRTAEVGISRHGTALAHPGRSGGRPALQLPRASFPHGSSAFRLHTDRAPQKLEFPATVLPSSIRGGLEGDRPSSTHGIIPARKFRLSSPIPPAHRRSRKTKTAPFRKSEEAVK